MVRPRINQFADDLGVTRSQAVKLINEGRRRSDGGSQTVETHMSEVKQDTKKKRKEHNEDVAPKNPGTLYDAMEQADLDADVEKRAMGGMCRGGGAAIQGMKYTGCK